MKFVSVIGWADSGCLADLALSAAVCFQGVSMQSKQTYGGTKTSNVFTQGMSLSELLLRPAHNHSREGTDSKRLLSYMGHSTHLILSEILGQSQYCLLSLTTALQGLRAGRRLSQHLLPFKFEALT